MPSQRTRGRPLARLGAGAVLALVAAALLVGRAPTQPAKKLPAPLPGDLRLVPTDCFAFVTVRLAEVKRLPLLQSAGPLTHGLGGGLKDVLEAVPVAPEEVERVTLVVPALRHRPEGDPFVMIVRAKKPLDREAVLKRLVGKARVSQVKSAGRTLHVSERGEAVYFADARTLAVGRREALALTLEAAAKGGGGPLHEARRLAAGKHHAVAGLRPAHLLTLSWRAEMEAEATPAKVEIREGPKGEGKEAKVLPVPPAPRPVKAKPRPLPSPKEALAELQPELWAVKPLLEARAVALALDLGDEVGLTARFDYADEAGAADGAVAARSAFYVAREALPRLFEDALGAGAREGPLPGLFKSAQADLRAARVVREGTTVRATFRHKVDGAALAKAVLEVTRLQEEKRRENNLRQIALALLNYEAANGKLPGAMTYGLKGEPLLSWRVAILPYLEQDNLFRAFHFNEPWDSPHNKSLLPRMPAVFAPPPGAKTKGPHQTYLRGLAGKSAFFLNEKSPFPAPPVPFFQPGPGHPLRLFTDGTSNTLAVVEAREAVPWTKPDELVYDAKKPLPKIGIPGQAGFWAAFADGAVRQIDRRIDEKLLRALITINGGEWIEWKKVPVLRGDPRPVFKPAPPDPKNGKKVGKGERTKE